MASVTIQLKSKIIEFLLPFLFLLLFWDKYILEHKIEEILASLSDFIRGRLLGGKLIKVHCGRIHAFFQQFDSKIIKKFVIGFARSFKSRRHSIWFLVFVLFLHNFFQNDLLLYLFLSSMLKVKKNWPTCLLHNWFEHNSNRLLPIWGDVLKLVLSEYYIEDKRYSSSFGIDAFVRLVILKFIGYLVLFSLLS